MPLKFRAIHEKIPPCQPPWQPSNPSVWAQLQVAASDLQEKQPVQKDLSGSDGVSNTLEKK